MLKALSSAFRMELLKARLDPNRSETKRKISKFHHLDDPPLKITVCMVQRDYPRMPFLVFWGM
jgi:hypothetical protein